MPSRVRAQTCPAALLYVFVIMGLPLRAYSAELDSVTFADRLTVEGNTLVLNGMGTRKATIFGIRVYVAGLYLQNRMSSEQEILASPEPHYLILHMVRDVSRDDIIDAWESGFQKNVLNPERFATELKAITAQTPDMHVGEELRILFHADRVQIDPPSHKMYEVKAAGFGSALLSIWLGSSPPNQSLKSGLLGNP